MKLGIGIACALLCGCPPLASTPVQRDVARASVLLMVDALNVADTLCANLAAEAHGAPIAALHKASALAHKCASGKEIALHGAEVARAAINAWESGGDGKLACAAVEVVDGLHAISEAVTDAGGTLPPVVVDAIDRAEALASLARGGVCGGH